MPQAEEPQVIVELTRHTLHALRAVNGTIEAAGECILENKPALEALLGAVAPAWKADGIKASASVWPDGIGWHISTDTEAMLDRTGESLRAIAAANQEDPKAPLAYAACNAGDGGPVTPEGMDRWILACTTRDSLELVTDILEEFKIESDGIGSTAFSRIGGVSAVLRLAGKGAVALWDLGIDGSHLLLVTANGVEGTAPCDIGLEAIFEAVQTVLRLKFRGASSRLFFNEGYDFTEPGPKVGAIIGAKLKEALSRLPHSEGPPALSCLGLTGKQAWFVREVAAAAGTAQWEPDIGKLAGELGLKFSDDAVAASFSPTSVGLLGLLGSRVRGRETWRPTWNTAEAPSEEIAPTPIAEPEPEPAPVARPAPPPARARPSIASAAATPTPFPTKPAKPIVAPKAAPARPPAPPPAAPAPSFSRPSFVVPPEAAAGPAAASPPRQAPSLSARAAAPAVGSTPPHAGAPAPPSAGSAPPQPAATPLPPEAAKLKPVVAAAARAPQEPQQPKSKVGFYIGLGVVAALVFAAIMVVLDAHNERIKAADLEQQEATAHHVAELRLKEAEESAREDAERARKDLEAAIEVTRKQTADQTRRDVIAEQEAERLAKLPGALVFATAPAGASVSIDGAAPIRSPVKLEGVAPGKHRVQIALAGHESVDLTVDVKGSKTNDLGTIPLGVTLGTIELASVPDAIDYAIRPAGDPSGKPVRTGKTPATLDDVLHGDYVVTFSRPGCRDHVEKVTVARGGKSRVATTYVNGSLELTSDPSGAWVDKDGIRVGSTPLALHDLTPKRATFELTLPGYDPTPVICDIPEGGTLKVDTQLLRRDRVFKLDEVKRLPVSIESPQPVLSSAQRRAGAEVLVSFIVRRDGTVSDVEVRNATDDDIGRRCKAAVENWKFRPATAADDRVVDVRIEKNFKFPASNS